MYRAHVQQCIILSQPGYTQLGGKEGGNPTSPLTTPVLGLRVS